MRFLEDSKNFETREFELASSWEDCYNNMEMFEIEEAFGSSKTRYSKAYALINKDLGKELKNRVKKNLENRTIIQDILEECEFKLYLEEDITYVRMKAKQDNLAIVEFDTDLDNDVYSLADLKNPKSNQQLIYYMEEAKLRGYKAKTLEDLMKIVKEVSNQDSVYNAFLITAHECELVPGVYEFVGDKLYINNCKLLHVKKVKNVKN